MCSTVISLHFLNFFFLTKKYFLKKCCMYPFAERLSWRLHEGRSRDGAWQACGHGQYGWIQWSNGEEPWVSTPAPQGVYHGSQLLLWQGMWKHHCFCSMVTDWSVEKVTGVHLGFIATDILQVVESELWQSSLVMYINSAVFLPLWWSWGKFWVGKSLSM